jgi:hypothetical protein
MSGQGLLELREMGLSVDAIFVLAFEIACIANPYLRPPLSHRSGTGEGKMDVFMIEDTAHPAGIRFDYLHDIPAITKVVLVVIVFALVHMYSYVVKLIYQLLNAHLNSRCLYMRLWLR